MTVTKKHLSHAAKVAGVPLADLTAAIESTTIGAAVVSIRDRVQKRGTCTLKAARDRYDAALPVVSTIREHHAIGERRRQKAAPAAPVATKSLTDRKSLAIRKLLPSLPGGRYSGDTNWAVVAVSRASVGASTSTSYVDRYSNSCKYSKADATHNFRVCLADLVAARRTPVPTTIDGEIVVRAQQVRDRVYEVTTLADGNGKSVACHIRYAADQGDGRWHLGKTERGAVVALGRSDRLIEAQRVGTVNAEVCRSWGWCSAGIVQWCNRHGITRNLQARLRSGTTSAAIARLIRKHGGPVNAYERRLVDAAR